MADNSRDKRRAKRLARQKKKRSAASRPGRDGGGASVPSFKVGIGWPPGDCFLSAGWDKPGARIHAVFTRSHTDGRSIAAFVEVNRSGPGVLSARVVALPSAEAVLGECIQISEASGDLGFAGAPPAVVAGVLADAEQNGEAALPEAWSRVQAMVQGVEPEPMDAEFGPAPPVSERSGLLDRLFRMLG